MDAALGHYVARLGFRMARSWAPDGKVRWCWLEHGPAALMLQQYDTEGANARPFEGRRGAGGAFVVVADRAIERSVAFYRDILGYREAGGAGGQTCRLQRDEADVVLRQETSPPERRGQGVSICHMCHDAIAYYREVTARGSTGQLGARRVQTHWFTRSRSPVSS